MSFGENVKKIREENHYTQQQLADKLYVSRQTVCRWENGSRCPDLIMAKKLAMELGVGLDELIFDEDVEEAATDVYGLWTAEKLSERRRWREMQKRIFGFIEIVSSFFLVIQLFLIYLDVRMPLWGTAAGLAVFASAYACNYVVSKKLGET
jgi:transcriptional regulator with XRE-family HTH domain